MDPVIHPIFPTAVYHANIPNISSPNPKDFKKDVLGGVNSGNEFTTNYHVLDSKQYKPLKKHIQAHIDNYVKDIVNPSTQFNVDITLSHINWIPKGGFHQWHPEHGPDLTCVNRTDYGAGDGSSTFALPDLQDKVPLGHSGSKAVASTGGAATVSSSGSITVAQLTPAGNVGGSTAATTISTSNMPSHSHDSGIYNYEDATRNPSGARLFTNQQDRANNFISTGNTGGGGSHSHNMSANFSGTAVTPTANFSGSATSVVQPYVAVKYMIKT